MNHSSDSNTSATEINSGTSPELKTIVQELLKNGSINSGQTAARYQTIVRFYQQLRDILEPLDLDLKLDETRGLALLIVSDAARQTPEETWSHPLVRRQRLTLEQSLLIAFLRRHYLLAEQEGGIGVAQVTVHVEDLFSEFITAIGDSGSDAKNQQRLHTLLDQLKPHGIVSEPDKNQILIIHPLIVHLANPETLTALLEHFHAQKDPPPETS